MEDCGFQLLLFMAPLLHGACRVWFFFRFAWLFFLVALDSSCFILRYPLLCIRGLDLDLYYLYFFCHPPCARRFVIIRRLCDIWFHISPIVRPKPLIDP